MLKSLILVGGRGKAGAILKTDSKKAAQKSKQLLGKKFKGLIVKQLLVEEHYLNFGTTTDDDWSNDVQLIADIGVGDHMYVGFVVGLSDPDTAAEEMYGDETAFMGELLFSVFF